MLLCTLDQLPSTAPSNLNLQFLTQTPHIRTGVNTLVGTNQDKVPWNASGLDPPSGFPAAVSQLSEIMILSEEWPIEAEASFSTCLISSTKAFPLCDETTPNPLDATNKGFKHLQRRTALIWGGKGR